MTGFGSTTDFGSDSEFGFSTVAPISTLWIGCVGISFRGSSIWDFAACLSLSRWKASRQQQQIVLFWRKAQAGGAVQHILADNVGVRPSPLSSGRWSAVARQCCAPTRYH